MIRWLVLALAACGPPSDYCSRAADVRVECGFPEGDAATDHCEDSLDACSAADLATLDGYARCLEELDCADVEAWYDCAARLEPLEERACGS